MRTLRASISISNREVLWVDQDEIAVIIPCFNEAPTIGKVVDDFHRELPEGFQIETELSIHAVDRRWRIADVPVEYRDRPEGSVSKLNTVKDGLKVIAMIGILFKDYRPLKFFSLVALAFCIGGLFAGMPVVTEYLATGLVPRFPTAILAAALMFMADLSLATGFILDAVAKVERKQWELRVYRQTENK